MERKRAKFVLKKCTELTYLHGFAKSVGKVQLFVFEALDWGRH